MNQKEIELLTVLMKSDQPMALPDILNQYPQMVKSTVAVTLAKLLKADLIRVSGLCYSGKSICRKYEPTVNAREAILNNLTNAYSEVCDVISQSEYVSALLHLNKDTVKANKEIAVLKKILEDYETQNKIPAKKDETKYD